MNPRGPTHFGPYDDSEREGAAPGWPRRVRMALRAALLAAAVVLAGLFLFPAESHAGALAMEPPTVADPSQVQAWLCFKGDAPVTLGL